jgi:hypothetical protein
VTHPFHPLFGREYPLVTYRYSWGENRVYFYDDQGQLISIPAEWTSVCPSAAVIEQTGGRAFFCVADLLELADLVQTRKNRGGR